MHLRSLAVKYYSSKIGRVNNIGPIWHKNLKSVKICKVSWKLIENADKRLEAETWLSQPAAGGDVRIALGYPNTYFVGMSNLGMQTVYGLLNNIPGVSCERFFLPDPSEIAEYEKSGRRLFTLESQRPVSDFDAVAFTLAYEPDYINLLRCLDLAGLPIYSKDRTANQPLVLVGGAVTLLNPEPAADFIDVFCVGEGEALVSDIVRIMRCGSKSEAKNEFAKTPGFYVPDRWKPYYENGHFAGIEGEGKVERAVLVPELYSSVSAQSLILTEDTELGHSGLVEISRGCVFACRFCTVSFSYPKIRWKPLERVWRSCEDMLKYTDKIGLISATAGTYPEIDELCRRLRERGAKVAFSSLRTDSLPDTLLETLAQGGAKSLTLAPEVGSDALRFTVNKRFTDAQYLETAERVFKSGIKNIKMYSMVGLPGEREEHLDALADLASATRKLQVSCGHGAGRITLSVGQFVPKPMTPYQWSGMLNRKQADKRMKYLEKKIGRIGAVSCSGESPKQALVQGLLARGDRRWGKVLERVYKLNPGFGDWQKAFKAEGIDMDDEACRERELDGPLPWDHLNGGYDRLLRDREQAMRRIEQL